MTKPQPKIQPSEFRWDAKTQWLHRAYKKSENGRTDDVKQTYTKDAAKTLFEQLKTQHTNIVDFVTKTKKIKEDSENTDNVPMYKEVEYALKVAQFKQDQRVQQQLVQAEKDLELVTVDFEALKKVIPANLS